MTQPQPQSQPPRRRRRRMRFGIGHEEKIYLVENLSLLLAAGVPVVETLVSIRDSVKSKALKRIIDEMGEDVEAGAALSSVVATSRIFPDYIVSLIKLGETSGSLVDNLRLAAEEQARSEDFRSKVRSAMLYPVFVFGLALIIGVGISWFILPKLSAVFSSLDIPLPIFTVYLIAMGEFLGAHGNVAVPAFVATLIVLFYFVFLFPKTRVVGQWLVLSIPGVRNVIHHIEIARFGYVLGTLLSAGLPVTQSLQALSEASLVYRYKRFYRFLHDNIEIGHSFKYAFEHYPRSASVIPPPVQQLIITGEKSGNLSVVLAKVGQIYTNKSEQTFKNISVIIEPVLLVVVWLGVIFIALAVILPIYNLVGQLNS